jgi:hypothetical protein
MKDSEANVWFVALIVILVHLLESFSAKNSQIEERLIIPIGIKVSPRRLIR